MAYLSLELQAFAGAVRLLSINILDPLLVYINSWQAYYYHCHCSCLFSYNLLLFISQGGSSTCKFRLRWCCSYVASFIYYSGWNERYTEIKTVVMLDLRYLYIFIPEVQVPIAILGAEVDQYCPPEVLKQFDEALSAKSEVKIFKAHNEYFWQHDS